MRQKRISDYGYRIGHHENGPRNKITDVPGVRVGHATVESGNQHTGVTVIVPGEGNPFLKKYLASAYVHNGFGKTCGLVQVQELGTLETPIALTNTLNVGKVADAMISWMIQQTKKEGEDVFSINPVVGECNDSRINEICNRVVGEKELYHALEQADTDFAEGDIGAGTGTICYGLKGGIGSASRTLVLDGKTYTIGVLVQSNFGATRDLKISGKPAGEKILERIRKEECGSSAEDRGSIMTVLATDLPVSERQLYRIIRRCGVGIARTGAYTGHGSGEIMIGFTTANRVDTKSTCEVEACARIKEEKINEAFEAAAEAVEEAILNSMVTAKEKRGLDGARYRSLAEFLEIPGGRKLSEYGAQSRFGYKGFSVGQSVFDCQAACFRMRRYERKNLILKVGEGNVSHLAGAEVRWQIGKLQLMAAVPGKQAAGQIVQLMNISGVRIFLQKAQKTFRKDPVAGHIGVVEKLKQKVIEKIGNILPASAERDSLKL